MNNLTVVDAPATMSSREIAALTGKNHADVMRDVRRMLDSLELVESKFAGHYIAANGKSNPVFNLPKRESLILVSGYRVQMRATIIDRWQELEAQAAKPVARLPDFTNPAIAARAWADEVEQKLILTGQVKTMEPKVQVYDTIMASAGLIGFRDLADQLKSQINEWELIRLLRRVGWVGRANSQRAKLRVRSFAAKRGFMRTLYPSTQNGVGRNARIMFTPLGVEKATLIVAEYVRQRRAAA